MMLPELTSPATRTVLPMNDSLYGAAHLELDRQGPVVVALPADTDGRYYSVSVMDGNFTNVLHLGPRWSGRDAVEVLLVPPGWDGEAPEGLRVVESPTASVCLLNRILVLDTEGDLDRVRAWRTGFTLRPLDGPLVDVEHADLVHPDAQVLADPWRFLEIGAEHLRRNPLPAPATWATSLVPVDELLAARDEPWSREAVEAGVADAQAMVDATLTDWPRTAGWRLPFPGMGLPTDRVLDTAALELFQVGYNDMAEATYFFGDFDADGAALDAAGGAEYELTFAADDLPPVHPDGFWSLTMYGTDNLLVANDLERYSTRPTRPGFRTGADGSVTITLSHRPPASGDGPELAPRTGRAVPPRAAPLLPEGALWWRAAGHRRHRGGPDEHDPGVRRPQRHARVHGIRPDGPHGRPGDHDRRPRLRAGDLRRVRDPRRRRGAVHRADGLVRLHRHGAGRRAALAADAAWRRDGSGDGLPSASPSSCSCWPSAACSSTRWRPCSRRSPTR